MEFKGKTILITGGGSGIGFALAERFLNGGSVVIVCGRNEEKLKEAKSKFPQLNIRVCDVANSHERINLFQWTQREFPELNVLVNNAGIQDRFSITEKPEDWERHHKEIAINFEAPVHLSQLFVPQLEKMKDAYIINVTSGLAFIPGSFAPIYSATKAAMHSFTMSLRHQVKKSGIKVIEIIPPAVQTDLGGAGLHTFGEPLNEFADAVMSRVAAGEIEIGYGMSEQGRKASREQIDAQFEAMNNRWQ